MIRAILQYLLDRLDPPQDALDPNEAPPTTETHWIIPKSRCSMIFGLSPKEELEFIKWDAKHLKERHNGKVSRIGAIGGRISFTFVDTSIGQIVNVNCGACQESYCLTDDL